MKFTDVTPNLIVSDLDRSLAFYRDVLGFSLVTTVPDAAPFVFAWLKRDEVNVFLNSVGLVKDCRCRTWRRGRSAGPTRCSSWSRRAPRPRGSTRSSTR